MDAVAAAADFPLGKLFWQRIQQSRIPNQRHRNRAAIHQIYADGVFRKAHILHALIYRQRLLSSFRPPMAISRIVRLNQSPEDPAPHGLHLTEEAGRSA